MEGIGQQRQRMDEVSGYQLDEEEDGADHHHGDDPRGLGPCHGDDRFAPRAVRVWGGRGRISQARLLRKGKVPISMAIGKDGG